MMEEGTGAIDLNKCELSFTYNGRHFRLRAFNDNDCWIFISVEGAEVFCAIRTIEELSYSQEVPDVVNWLARMLKFAPARYRQSAYARNASEVKQ